MTARLGTLTCYRQCLHRPEGPHPECRQKSMMQKKRERVRRARIAGRSLEVNPGPIISAAKAVSSIRMTYKGVSRRAGAHPEYLEHMINRGGPVALRRATDQIATQLRKEIDDAYAALQDALDYLDAYDNPSKQDGARWPTAPLRQWAVDHGVAVHNLLNQADARYIYRNPTLDTDRAERFTNALQVHPEHVWGMTWFGIDDQQVAS